MNSETRRPIGAIVLALAIAVAVPTAALASKTDSAGSNDRGTVVSSVLDVVDPGCGYATSQAFKAFGDPARYFLVPGGDAESNRWAGAGGAAVVAGKGVLSTGSFSYALPQGASVTSSSFCVSLDSPTVRLSVKDPGVAGAVLRLDVLWTSPIGLTVTLPIATVLSGRPGVRLVDPALMLTNLAALVGPGRKTNVKLRLTAVRGLLAGRRHLRRPLQARLGPPTGGSLWLPPTRTPGLPAAEQLLRGRGDALDDRGGGADGVEQPDRLSRVDVRDVVVLGRLRGAKCRTRLGALRRARPRDRSSGRRSAVRSARAPNSAGQLLSWSRS